MPRTPLSLQLLRRIRLGDAFRFWIESRFRLALCVACLTVLGTAAAHGPAPTVLAATAAVQEPESTVLAATQQAPGNFSYKLVDNWARRPWSLTAGRYGYAGDISSARNGTTYVLDRKHSAVHILAPDGKPLSVVTLPYPKIPPSIGESFVPERLDVGSDGTIHVLAGKPTERQGKLARVDRLAPDGRPLGFFELDVDYNDIAAAPGGDVFLSRIFPLISGTATPRGSTSPKGGVDLFQGMSGAFIASLPEEPLYYCIGVDVAADGTVFVLNRVPSPGGGQDPRPPATPYPSLGGPSLLDAAAASPTDGIVVFTPDRLYQETVPMANPEDIAVGPPARGKPDAPPPVTEWPGVYVARHMEIFALGEKAPLYTGPAGQLEAPYFGGAVFHLDVGGDGTLRASMAHCYFQGMLDFGQPVARPARPRLFGDLDRPDLEGPANPLRLAASGLTLPGLDEVSVLQGRFAVQDETRGGKPVRRYFAEPYADQPQTVQQFDADGHLLHQMGVCGGTLASWTPEGNDAWWVRDVARDGAESYTIDPVMLRHRPDNGFPAWSYWPGQLASGGGEASRLVAVAADAGRVAVLDGGLGRVLVLGRDGVLAEEWALAAPTGPSSPSGPPSSSSPGVLTDVALSRDHVYVADAGRNEVRVHTLGKGGGTDLAWSVHDGPSSIATGPSGDVFVLGRGGWAYRYRPDGTLVATWPMPDQAAEARDIAVGAGDRVFVAYLTREWLPGQGRDRLTYEVTGSGVWVFAPTPVAPSPPPAPGACVARPEKSAAPGLIRLGETVGVELLVTGRCPGRYEPVQVAIAFDTSRSMNWNDILPAAQDGATTFLAALDPRTSEAALATFADVGAVQEPLTHDLDRVARRIRGLSAWGDTRMRTGIPTAAAELLGPRGNPGVRRILLLVTDADLKDYPTAEAQAARDAGIELYMLAFPQPSFGDLMPSSLAVLLGSRDHLLLNPDRLQLERLARDLTLYVPEPGLFETITVTDLIPANMRFVQGSDSPRATLAGSTLTWRLPAIAAARGIRLQYRLQPAEVGTWPTNVFARADYRDALGNDGELVFPIPQVIVWDRSSLSHHVYLPYGASRACFRSDLPLDVVLLLDTSQSMAEPAAGGATKLDAAKAAALAFVDLLRLTTDRVAVVAFNESALRVAGLTHDRQALRAALSGLTTTPGTRIDRGLAEARAVLSGRRPEAKPVLILLTDGIQNGSADPVRAEADLLKAAGTRVYAIGLGADVDRALLQEVASTPEGYFESPAAGDLAAIYQQISERLACEVR